MFCDKLKRYRKNAKLTQKRLGELINAGESTISEWESGKRSPDIERLPEIAKALGVLPSDLLDADNSAPRTLVWAEPLVDAYTAAPELTQRSVCNVLEIPHVKPWGDNEKEDEADIFDYSSAAGSGNYIDSDAYETLSFPAGTVPSAADCGVRISGHSMEPDIKDGDIVWVHETCEILNHQVGIFIINEDHAVCKRAKFDEYGRLVRLMSDNPSISDIEVEDLEDIRVFGRVLGAYTPE